MVTLLYSIQKPNESSEIYQLKEKIYSLFADTVYVLNSSLKDFEPIHNIESHTATYYYARNIDNNALHLYSKDNLSKRYLDIF